MKNKKKQPNTQNTSIHSEEHPIVYLYDGSPSGLRKLVKSAISFGSALAMAVSYTAWHSIGWAVAHGLMSWGYIVYYMIKY